MSTVAEKKTRGPIDPNSPAGIRNAWSKAKREFDAQLAKVEKLETTAQEERAKLAELEAERNRTAERLKALL